MDFFYRQDHDHANDKICSVQWYCIAIIIFLIFYDNVHNNVKTLCDDIYNDITGIHKLMTRV